MSKQLEWKTTQRKVNDLLPLEINPRKITDQKRQKLINSIQKFNLAEIPAINADNTIISGHQRMKAMQLLQRGEEMIDVRIPNRQLTLKELKEYNLISNTHAGEFDFDKLDEFFDDMDFADIGFDVERPAEMELPPVEINEDDDIENVEEYANTVQTDIVLGDLFEIGNHRLLCGDSTKKEDVERLMDGKKADICFTSPPYNVGGNSKLSSAYQKNGRKYANDDDDKSDSEYLKFLVDVTENSIESCQYTFINIQSLSGNKIALIDFLFTMKKNYADTLIWKKKNEQPAMPSNVLNSQFEYIHCFSKKANRSIGTKPFRGTVSNVIEISNQTRNDIKLHNATFPIELSTFFISNFTNESVVDFFMGTGTTMVAAHQLNKKCYGIELEPQYCQTIIDRMKKLFPGIEVKKL